MKTVAISILLVLAHITIHAQDRVQCDTSNIPTGWVIVDVKKCSCCGTAERQWTIRRVDLMPEGSIVLVCSADKLPEGWLVSNKKVCMCCAIDGEYGTQYTIKKTR